MLCFVLHFYQPSNQLPEVFKDVVKNCYAPLIKVLKENKKLSLTINMPLALLEQLDLMGYTELINDVRLLADQGRVELTGTGAYHPLLSRLPASMVYSQIVLNELAYGYYFGADKDFEGEDCYMIKNIKGFFPPEMAVSPNLMSTLSDMGYEWVLLDEYSLPEEVKRAHGNGLLYTVGGCSTKVLIRNRGLSNLLAFNREFNVGATLEDIKKNGDGAVIALDAETFGHHYRDGVAFFDNLTVGLSKAGVDFVTLSQAIKYMEARPLPEILESTWSTVGSSIYPMWCNDKSPANVALWELFDFVHSHDEVLTGLTEGEGDSGKKLSADGAKPRPFWLDREGAYARDNRLLNLLKSEQSDAFWWSTGADIAGKKTISRHMVVSVLDYYKGCAELFGPKASEILKRVELVEKEANLLE